MKMTMVLLLGAFLTTSCSHFQKKECCKEDKSCELKKGDKHKHACKDKKCKVSGKHEHTCMDGNCDLR
jgi:hypothetical protein